MNEIASTSLVDNPKTTRRAFLLRKLHSLTGALPVGGFLLVHLWTNATALQGRERFDQAVSGISHLPYLPIIEVALIFAPLAFHAIYGVKLTLEGRFNNVAYPYSRNWMYALQRVTGVVALAFIGFHLYEYWFQKLTGNMAPEDFYPALCRNLASTWNGVPLRAIIYLVGIAASVFHFANGLFCFCFSWGVTVSRRSQRMAAAAFAVFGLIVFLLGANTAIYFATGARVAIFGAPAGHGTTVTCAETGAATRAAGQTSP